MLRTVRSPVCLPQTVRGCGSYGLLVQNPQSVFLGHHGVGMRCPEGIAVEVEFVTVADGLAPGRHRDEALPAIGHHGSGPHGIEVVPDDDFRADGLPPDALLPAVKGGFDGIQVIGVSALLMRGQIRDVSGATRQQQWR